MSGTSASTRTAPPRRFENYVLTKTVDSNVGLTNIDDKQFVKITSASEIADGDGTYVVISIGFKFQIDGIWYDKIAVDPNGWAALVDPSTGTFNSNEVVADTEDNTQINSTFTSNAVLLAPWFDNLRNVLSDVSHLSISPFNYSAEKIERISQGIEPPPAYWNPSSYGTSYYLDRRSPQGQRLIIRWACLANAGTGVTITLIKFEVVLYENGTIEFRYAPRSGSPSRIAQSYEYESATVGIFMPGGNSRFRDFSPGLGYQDDRRQEYAYGGAVYDASFTDDGSGAQDDGVSGIPYVHNLWSTLNWPGSHVGGCIMTFAPPKNRRKILPRKLIHALDSNRALPIVSRNGFGRINNRIQQFDDRKTPNYTSGTRGDIVVNYPTTLPRFFGGDNADVTERQDLFAGDFLVTGSIVPSAIEQYIGSSKSELIEAFNETSRPEQDEGSQFFLTGSSIELFSSFGSSLKTKTQLKFSLPVDYNVQMPGASSSIYYYNSKTHSWNVPINSSDVLLSGSSVQQPGAHGDWSNPASWHYQGFQDLGWALNEDARGFGPYGNVISSGSHNPNPANDGLSIGEKTDFELMRAYNQKLTANAIGKEYPKSIRNNPEYQPTQNETFKLQIDEPMLLEKAVFEIPFSAGPGWFDDQTRVWRPQCQTSNALGLCWGGPALTVALYRKIQFGRSIEGIVSSSLDLIMTGTIIPAGDDVSQVVFEYNGPDGMGPNWVFGVKGFRSAGYPASAVVSSNDANFFTGSVKVKSTALNSVGVMLMLNQKAYALPDMSEQMPSIYRFLEETPTINLNNSDYIVNNLSVNNIAGIAPFGRSATGLTPSGRSVLGRELETLQRKSDPGGQLVANPLYLGPGALHSAEYLYISESLGAIEADSALLNQNSIEFLAPVSLISHSPCPYLVMPNDEFVLSISKMHPYVANGLETTNQWFSGSVANHDVGLITGSINITLYGSKVRAGVEFNDPSSQRIGSEVLSEVIGNEPVLDQFDAPYSRELSGSNNDRFNVERAVQYLFIGRSQGTEFASASPAVSSSYDTQIYYSSVGSNVRDVSWSSQRNWTRSRKIFELQKSSRNSVFTCDKELIWDSRIPDPRSMLSIQSPGLALGGATTAGSAVVKFGLMTGREYGELVDYLGTPPSSGSRGMGDWIMSFPFEPRWSGVSHTFANELRGASYPIRIDPVTFSPRYVMFSNMTFEYGNIKADGTRIIATETNQETSGNSLGTGHPEFIKFMYGFGDGRSATADNCHVTHRRKDPDYGTVAGTELRGWRHGLASGFPLHTISVFRRDHYGYVRDMLEQRLDTKFFNTSSAGVDVSTSPVAVRFVDSSGRTTLPEYTYSSNLSFEATSSLPFFDGVVRNREEPISLARTNQSIVVV